MTMSAIKWIVTDLDGTLVGADLQMVDRSVRALGEFRDRGGEVFIATGRNAESARPYYDALDLSTPAILCNGARVVEMTSGKLIYSRTIGDHYAALHADVIATLPPHIGAVAFVNGEPMIVCDAPALKEYARRDRIILGRPPAPAPLQDVVKVLFVSDRPELDALAAQVSGVAPDLTIVRSEPTYLEVLPVGASKGAALQWLTESTGVDLSEVAAIGDNFNDVDMIRRAGIGAVPGSAAPEVRDFADVVVGSSVADAIADLVHRILIGE